MPTIKEQAPTWEMRPIESLTANPRNARKHPDKQIELLKRSLTQFGWIAPAIVNSDGVLLAGHGRLEAAKQLGMTHVPCVIASHLDDATQRAYMLADNQTPAQATWDLETLCSEIDAAGKCGLLDCTGFTQWELADLQKELGIDPKPKADKAPKSLTGREPESDTFWQVGEHLLCVGDSSDADFMHLCLERFGELPRYLVTDPPWELGPEKVMATISAWKAPEALIECSFKQAAFLESHGPEHGWRVIADLVAVNRGSRAGFVPTTRLPLKAHLYMLLMRREEAKGSWKQPKRGFRSVLGLEDEFYEGNGEGYRKDPRIFKEAIDGWRDRGAIIDPFGGHGTTAMAASLLVSPRRALLVEQDPSQALQCLDRLADAYGEPKRV